MEDKLPPIESESGSMKRFLGLFVLVQITLVLFAVTLFAFIGALAQGFKSA